ncbi:MAG: acetylglutamate kinase [Actinomycetota bacterium]|nr:acetylglutamate kinase [Actinomycetota bacterium]
MTEVLPYIREHRGKTFVVKLGGNAMERYDIREMLASDIVLMHYVGIKPVIVHGGGPQITEYMEKLEKQVNFVDGYRITDSETMEIAKMVLVGKINKDIVSLINRHGTIAMGLSGEDGNLIIGEKRYSKDGLDLGWVGDVKSVNVTVVEELLSHGLIPVIASVGTDQEGNSYNINADHVASEIASAMNAEKLIFLSNVKGVLKPDGSLISKFDVSELKELLASGEVTSGMIPKIESCVRALEKGVNRAHIIDGTVVHALLLELFTDEGIGTMIVKDDEIDDLP